MRRRRRIMAAKEISVKKYVVRLSGDEREQLEVLIRKGKSPAQRLLKARILVKADVSEAGDGWSDSRIVAALETSPSMVYRVRKQLVEEGFDAVLSRKQRATPAVAPIFDGEKEAKLIALACSKPPQGRARWTLRLLENKVVELKIVERASDSTIGRVLKKHSQAPSPTVLGHPAQGQQRVRGRDGGRAGRLHATARPRRPTRRARRAQRPRRRRAAHDRPLVCLDETSKQLTAETRLPVPMKPGRPARLDYEYERNGTANLFMLFAPLEGWRLSQSRRPPHRRGLCSRLERLGRYPLFRRPDHRPGPGQSQHPQQGGTLRSLSGRRSQAAGRAIRMPKLGSWLNLAESELGVLSSQCLDRRIPDKQILVEEVAAREQHRNANHANANWRFTTPDARIKLKHLYPSI